jgi:multiple sugar transport system permease protein
VNYILSFFGINGPNWLTSPTYALVAIMIVSIWKGMGYI